MCPDGTEHLSAIDRPNGIKYPDVTEHPDDIIDIGEEIYLKFAKACIVRYRAPGCHRAFRRHRASK